MGTGPKLYLHEGRWYPRCMADIGTAERRGLAKRNDALPDGSYPIRNCRDLHNAIQAYGRAPAEHRAALRRLIARRKRELGCDQPMPAEWHLDDGEGHHVIVRSSSRDSGDAKVRPDEQPSYRMKPRRPKRGDH